MAGFEETDRLLTTKEVARILSVAPRTVARLVKRPEFPQPIRYNRKLVRWKLSQIREWLRRQNPDG